MSRHTSHQMSPRLSPPVIVLRSVMRFFRQCAEMQIKVDNYH